MAARAKVEADAKDAPTHRSSLTLRRCLRR